MTTDVLLPLQAPSEESAPPADGSDAKRRRGWAVGACLLCRRTPPCPPGQRAPGRATATLAGPGYQSAQMCMAQFSVGVPTGQPGGRPAPRGVQWLGAPIKFLKISHGTDH